MHVLMPGRPARVASPLGINEARSKRCGRPPAPHPPLQKQTTSARAPTVVEGDKLDLEVDRTLAGRVHSLDQLVLQVGQVLTASGVGGVGWGGGDGCGRAKDEAARRPRPPEGRQLTGLLRPRAGSRLWQQQGPSCAHKRLEPLSAGSL